MPVVLILTDTSPITSDSGFILPFALRFLQKKTQNTAYIALRKKTREKVLKGTLPDIFSYCNTYTKLKPTFNSPVLLKITCTIPLHF